MLRNCLSGFTFLCAAITAQAQTPLNNVVPHRYLVVYRQGAQQAQVAAARQRMGMATRRNSAGLGIDAFALASDADVRSLARDPDVEFVLQDRVVRASRIQTENLPIDKHPLGHGAANPPGWRNLPVAGNSTADSDYSSPQGWAVAQVGAYGAGYLGQTSYGPWNLTMGAGIRIAVLDSGVDQQHPDIAPNIALNLTEIDQTAQPSPCDDGSPQDQQGHGTFSASLAAGAYGANTGLTVGVAPQAQILNIKVLQRTPDAALQCANGQASGLLSWTIQGIQDAIDNHANVIVMPFGTMVDLYTGDGAGLKTMYDRVTHAAAQAGIVLVASAGNDGFDFSNPRYLELPAQARDVLAVVASTNPACAENTAKGATCQAGPVSLAYYSNRGTPLNAVAAPGGSYPAGSDTGVTGWVRAACSNGKPFTSDGAPSVAQHSFGCFNLGHQQYVRAMGTSASAPLAAGVAALVMAAHPGWSAATVVNTLRNTAISSATMPYGVVNAAAALGIH